MKALPAGERVDEVQKYYRPAQVVDSANGALFWLVAIISLIIPYSHSSLGLNGATLLKFSFIVLTVIHFTSSQVLRMYLIPRAERMRRKQLLADALGAPISLDRTRLYYNNGLAPSIERLGACVMENAMFSKEVAARMLVRDRFIIAAYVVVWLSAFTWRHNNLDALSWITQIVFSGQVVASWLALELLRFRHEYTFDQLHGHFRHQIGDKAVKGQADLLYAFAEYETAKSSAGILLSSKVFERLNAELSERWERIKRDLDIAG